MQMLSAPRIMCWERSHSLHLLLGTRLGQALGEHREVIAKLAVDTKGFQTEGEMEVGVISVNNTMNENAAVF